MYVYQTSTAQDELLIVGRGNLVASLKLIIYNVARRRYYATWHYCTTCVPVGSSTVPKLQCSRAFVDEHHTRGFDSLAGATAPCDAVI